MAFVLPEIAEAGAGLLEGGEAAGAGAGAEADFDDAPVGKTIGARLGGAVRNDLAFHGAESLLGGGGHGGGGSQQDTGGVNLGPIGGL